MSEKGVRLSLNVNGQSKVPPGFRFQPTEEELLQYYLRKRCTYQKIDLDVIRDIDLNKHEPWDIEEKCKIGSTPQNDWYFFSHKDKKYPIGTRTNRATAAGFWKATGRDKVIKGSLTRIGMRKTLVFYKGRAPHGQKTDWIMYEYRQDDSRTTGQYINSVSNNVCNSDQDDGWVVCRVFRKKSYQKVIDNTQNSPSPSDDSRTQSQSFNEGIIVSLLTDMGKSINPKDNSMQQILNPVDNHSSASINYDQGFTIQPDVNEFLTDANHTRNTNKKISNNHDSCQHLNNWVDIERLVAMQLNSQYQTLDHLCSCYGEPNEDFCFSLVHQCNHNC